MPDGVESAADETLGRCPESVDQLLGQFIVEQFIQSQQQIVDDAEIESPPVDDGTVDRPQANVGSDLSQSPVGRKLTQDGQGCWTQLSSPFLYNWIRIPVDVGFFFIGLQQTARLEL